MAKVFDTAQFAPTMLDPRLTLLLPQGDRVRLLLLWELESRLFNCVVLRRETMLAQIKLAWWRERLQELASASPAIPKGEPLLADLGQHWAGSTLLNHLVDPFEAALLAETAADLQRASDDLADLVRRAHGVDRAVPLGQAWAAVRCGQMATSKELAVDQWERAQQVPVGISGNIANERALATLDGWAAHIASRGGKPGGWREAWLLLRLGAGL